LIIPRPVKYNYSAGEQAEIKLYISHYSSLDINNTELEWTSSSGESGVLKIPGINRTEVKQIQPLIFDIKKNTTGAVRIDFKLLLNNKVIAKNYSIIYAYPGININNNVSVEVINNKEHWTSFNNLLKKRYTGSDQMLLTNYIDEDLLSQVNLGKTIICLVDSNTIFTEKLPLKFISRSQEWYDGNWASNLNWRREHPFFININNSRYFGFEIAHSIPRLVISEIPPEDFSNVIAGMFAGWLQLNSAYIYHMNLGGGKILFCTFPIADNYETDPFAETLFDNIVSLLYRNFR
jgi:hypothetical protein